MKINIFWHVASESQIHTSVVGLEDYAARKQQCKIQGKGAGSSFPGGKEAGA
jgi:hypothetical protein